MNNSALDYANLLLNGRTIFDSEYRQPIHDKNSLLAEQSTLQQILEQYVLPCTIQHASMIAIVMPDELWKISELSFSDNNLNNHRARLTVQAYEDTINELKKLFIFDGASEHIICRTLYSFFIRYGILEQLKQYYRIGLKLSE